MERTEACARRLYEDHGAMRRIEARLPDEIAPRDVAEAYLVQDRLQALYLGAGKRVGGWKVALTTPVMQKLVGVGHPLEGAIFADRIHRSPARLKGADYVNLAVESEIAVRLGRALPAGAKPHDRDSVADAVAACMAGIEGVDDRACDYKANLSATLLIADNAWNFGCVVGPEVADWRRLDLAAAKGRMRINGEVVGEGKGGDVLGHPFEALAFLANSLNRRGRRLEAGDVVLTGSVVATKWLKPGDEMATEIEGLGEARLTVA
jgi:2-oxo-3-hexenedioate decarboxylase/2-keto-4-pentenoate hydratase